MLKGEHLMPHTSPGMVNQGRYKKLLEVSSEETERYPQQQAKQENRDGIDHDHGARWSIQLFGSPFGRTPSPHCHYCQTILLTIPDTHGKKASFM